MPSWLPGLLVLAVVALVAICIIWFIVKAFRKVAEPNEALLISGGRKQKAANADGTDESMEFRIVPGGQGAVVIPGIHTARTLDLSLEKTDLDVDCVTQQGIKVVVKASVIFKIGDTFPEIANAARRFRGKQQIMVEQVHSIFAGHLRAIIGNMTMEQLISDREALRKEVREASQTEMSNLGLKIDSMQILDIGDPSGYISNLSAPNLARAQSQARIAEAQRNQEATAAEQESAVAVAEAQTAARKRQSELQAEADRAAQTAAQAGPLAQALAQQEVVVAQTRAAELEADLTAKRLETDVRKPADARAYDTTVSANAERDAAIARAEAEARQTSLQAEADANAVRVRGTAEADSTKARGLAEAETVRARGLAEGDALHARATALAENQDAVVRQQVAEQLPAIAEAFAKPFGQIDNLTVLNGAEGMSQMVNGAMSQLVEALPKLLGLAHTVRSEAESSDDVVARR